MGGKERKRERKEEERLKGGKGKRRKEGKESMRAWEGPGMVLSLYGTSTDLTTVDPTESAVLYCNPA